MSDKVGRDILGQALRPMDLVLTSRRIARNESELGLAMMLHASKPYPMSVVTQDGKVRMVDPSHVVKVDQALVKEDLASELCELYERVK